ncbi:MAG: DUF3105 domain-containing protein [Anaerolineae bacterium]|nr:DUF3105 domain-containing protein [Anaerolineae bacterium]
MSQKSTPLKHKRNIDLQSRRCLGIVVTFERLFFSGIVLFIVGAFVVLAFNAWQNRIVSIDSLSRRVGLLRSHEDNVGYGTGELPPMGGTHNQVWQNCGVYETLIRSDLAVHSLEHGAVWITYHPELQLEQVEKLREITRGGSHRLLSPFPGLASPVVVTAWGYQVELKNADDSRLIDFINNYEQGTGSPEPGALCSGGIGEPLN